MFELANRALFEVENSIEKLPGSLDARKKLLKTTLDYLERLRIENGLDDRMSLTLSQAYLKVSMMQGSHYFPSLQDFKSAEASLRRAAAIILPLYEKNPGNPQVTSQYLDIQIELANNLQEADRPEAVRIYNQYRQGNVERAMGICSCSRSCLPGAYGLLRIVRHPCNGESAQV